MFNQVSLIVSRIFDFNKSVVGINRPTLRPLPLTEAVWLRTAICEEGNELHDDTVKFTGPQGTLPLTEEDRQDLIVAQVDACVDAAIFAIGGLARLGLSRTQAEAVLHAVMDANFEKKAGVKEGRTGAPDAIKPEGWTGPEARIKEILFHG